MIHNVFNDFNKTLPKFDATFAPEFQYNKSDVLLFEHSSKQGFRNCIAFDQHHIKVVLKVLAKFHAASFAYEEAKSRETGNTFRLNQKYQMIYCNTDLAKPEVIQSISSMLDDVTSDDLSKIIKDLETRQSSSKFRRTLSHGNLTSDNVMFKYSENNPVDCQVLNFKSTPYLPPVCDVLQLIFFNTSEATRQIHFHRFLNYYYKSLEEELENYSINIEVILSSHDWQLQAHYLSVIIKLECALRNIPGVLEEFKEDLDCPLLSRQDCYAIVQNKFKDSNYNVISFKVNPLESASGFLGDYHKLEIGVRRKNENHIVNCFVKCTPTVSAAKEVVRDSNGFSKEAFVYQILVPKFQEFGIELINDCLPGCYFQRAKDLIVFEDVAALGYKSQSAQIPYDFDTLCMLMKKLARFHASAFVYEEKMSRGLGRQYRLNGEYGVYFKEAIIVQEENHYGGKLMANGLKSVLDAANQLPELKTEENVQSLEKFWPELCRLFYSTLTASDRFRNVLTHGDLWSSNILIKFENDRAVDCRFVDYQLLRYCPPGHDLLAILHMTTIRDIRQKHEDDLIKVYYEELTRLVELFDFSIDEIITYEDLIGGIDLMRPQMVVQAAIYGMFSMCTPEQIASMLTNEEECNRVFFEDRKDFLAKMCAVSPVYRSRLRDRVEDVYDLCRFMSK